MKTFRTLEEVVSNGFSVLEKIEGGYILLYGNEVVYDDPACEDLYSLDTAEPYFVDVANEMLAEVQE